MAEVAAFVPTETLKDAWQIQHTVYEGDWWVERYWNATEGPHRDAVIRALATVAPFSSVLEVGCNAGPNLRRIHARWPRVDLLGMDIHDGALKYGQRAARAEGWAWAGYCGDLRDLHLLGADIADVVLTCYSLAYLDPRDIVEVLDACLAAARSALIIAEPMALAGEPAKYAPPMPGVVPEYHHPYQDLLAQRGLESTMLPITPPENRLAHVLIVRRPLPAGSRAVGAYQGSGEAARTASDMR